MNNDYNVWGILKRSQRTNRSNVKSFQSGKWPGHQLWALFAWCAREGDHHANAANRKSLQPSLLKRFDYGRDCFGGAVLATTAKAEDATSLAPTVSETKEETQEVLVWSYEKLQANPQKPSLFRINQPFYICECICFDQWIYLSWMKLINPHLASLLKL